MKVNILGTEYEIIKQTEEENPKLNGAYGICEIYSKKIVLREEEDDPNYYENIEAMKNKTFRHEIIHAFFAESGLRNNCSFAEDEELVDWIAIQFPKILQVFEKLKIER